MALAPRLVALLLVLASPAGAATISLRATADSVEVGEVFSIIVEGDSEGETGFGVLAAFDYDPNTFAPVGSRVGDTLTSLGGLRPWIRGIQECFPRHRNCYAFNQLASNPLDPLPADPGLVSARFDFEARPGTEGRERSFAFSTRPSESLLWFDQTGTPQPSVSVRVLGEPPPRPAPMDAIPEPSAAVVFGAGLLLLAARLRRRSP